jgi:phosphoribosylformylglycinamidine (FGAM) synthase-like amidotransferase family enzyme
MGVMILRQHGQELWLCVLRNHEEMHEKWNSCLQLKVVQPVVSTSMQSRQIAQVDISFAEGRVLYKGER